MIAMTAEAEGSLSEHEREWDLASLRLPSEAFKNRHQAATELRVIAQRLTQMAAMLDLSGSARLLRRTALPSVVEERTETLARTAKRLLDDRMLRQQFLDPDCFGEPVWDILLDLFYNESVGRRVSISSACIASRIPHTSALRYLELMQKIGLVYRTPSKKDRRRSWLWLTEKASQAIAQYLMLRNAA